MIDIKKAIEIAKDYAADLLQVDRTDLLLEEVHWSEEYWEITLSFNDRIIGAGNPLAVMAKRNREFKSFRVRKETGDIQGMSNVPVY
jgi:hypothetical protein